MLDIPLILASAGIKLQQEIRTPHDRQWIFADRCRSLDDVLLPSVTAHDDIDDALAFIAYAYDASEWIVGITGPDVD